MMCKVMEDMRDRAWAEGRAEGMRENAVETAKRMLLKAMSPDMVAELCGLSLSEVQALSHV